MFFVSCNFFVKLVVLKIFDNTTFCRPPFFKIYKKVLVFRTGVKTFCNKYLYKIWNQCIFYFQIYQVFKKKKKWQITGTQSISEYLFTGHFYISLLCQITSQNLASTSKDTLYTIVLSTKPVYTLNKFTALKIQSYNTKF